MREIQPERKGPLSLAQIAKDLKETFWTASWRPFKLSTASGVMASAIGGGDALDP